MARKTIDMKDIFDIILLSKKIKNLMEINKRFPQYSYPTISRIVSVNNNSSASKYIKYREFILATNSWKLFKDKFFMDFPQPKYWPVEILKGVVRDSAKHSYKELLLKYSFNFSEATLKKLFETGEIKTALKAVLNTPVKCKMVEEEVEEKSGNFNEIAALVERIKALGAKEVIIKF